MEKIHVFTVLLTATILATVTAVTLTVMQHEYPVIMAIGVGILSFATHVSILLSKSAPARRAVAETQAKQFAKAS